MPRKSGGEGGDVQAPSWALIVRETRVVGADELDNPALRAKERVVRSGASPLSQLLKEGYSDDVKAVLALVQVPFCFVSGGGGGSDYLQLFFSDKPRALCCCRGTGSGEDICRRKSVFCV